MVDVNAAPPAVDPCGASATVYVEAAALLPSDFTDPDPVAPAYRTATVTCKRPRGHGHPHEDRDAEGRPLVQWST